LNVAIRPKNQRNLQRDPGARAVDGPEMRRPIGRKDILKELQRTPMRIISASG
jgi:hypothetical protein